MILSRFLSLADQHELIRAVDTVTATAPFTIPEVKHPFTGDAAFANVYMTHAGRFWSGTRSTYYPHGDSKAVFENLVTGKSVPVPAVPPAVMSLAEAAVTEALRRDPGIFERPPFDGTSNNFTAILNYYASWSSISPHCDSSEPSLKSGKTYPVVSFSIGDTAVFSLYPDLQNSHGEHTEISEPLKLLLGSGDVLLFGGLARLVRHSVEEIKSVGVGGLARPPGLKMVGGRLNITLRAL
jgi:alkylated DNA repair dioxygenase AlkB